MDQEPPNAGEWELRHDESSGQAYYLNMLTGESSWEAPPELKAFSTDAPIPSSREWREVEDENGLVYYMNMATMEKSWDAPPRDSPAAATNATLRPSTAEEMDQLNALLSGGDEDEEEQVAEVPNDGVSTEAPTTDTVGDGSEWMMFLNETDGHPYYYNHITGECVWEPPAVFLEYHAQLAENDAVGTNNECEDNVGVPSEMREPTPVTLTPLPQTPPPALEITPEFEEKVRRAVETVSKTPVGSSRLLFVRTPTVKSIDSSRPVSRPTSSSGASARQHIATARAIEPELSPEQIEHIANDQDSQETQDCDVTETLVPEPIQLPPHDDDEELFQREAMMLDLAFDEMALTIQCMVRCFQARARVAKKRKERQDLMSSQENCNVDTFEVVGDVNDQVLTDISVYEAIEEPTVFGESDVSESEPLVILQEKIESPEPGELRERDSEEGEALPQPSLENASNGPLDVTTEANDHENIEAAQADHVVEEAKTMESVRGDLESTEEPVADGSVDEEEVAAGLAAENDVPSSVEEPVLEETPVSEGEDKSVEVVESEHISIPPLLPAKDDEASVEIKDEMSIGGVPVSPHRGELAPTTSDAPEYPLLNVSIPSQDALAAPFQINECDDPQHLVDDENVSSTLLEDQQTNLSEEPQQSAELKQSDEQAHVESPKTRPGTRQERTSRRKDERPSARITRTHHTAAAPVDTSTGKLAIINISSYFPPKRQGLSGSDPAKCVTSEPATGCIKRKALSRKSAPVPKSVEERESERAMRVEAMQRSREDAGTKLAQEVQQYREKFAASAKCYAQEAQEMHSAQQIQHNHAQHERETWLLERQMRQLPHDSSSPSNLSLWELKNGNGTLQDITDRLRAALQPQAFVEVMMRERLYAINRTIERCEKSNQCTNEATDRSTYWRDLARNFPSQCGENANIDHPYWAKLHTKLLASATTEPNLHRELLCHRTHSFDSLLHAAAWQGHYNLVRFLVSDLHGDVNAIDCTVTKSTPLHEACRGGHGAVVDVLLAHGAFLDVIDVHGDTPLHIACRLGWIDIVHKLMAVGQEHNQADGLNASADIDQQQSSRVRNLQALSWTEYFYVRNDKHRRAVDLATLPSLIEFLTQYANDLQSEPTQDTSTDLAIGPVKEKKKKIKQQRPKSAAKLNSVSVR